MSIKRRDFVSLATAAALSCSNRLPRACSAETRTGMTLSFGTYGLKPLKVEAAFKLLATLGYDGVELTARPGWDSDPERVSQVRRQALRKQLDGLGLQLTAVMESLPPSADDQTHARQLTRLNRAVELAHGLSPSNVPVVQTIVGGGRWEEKRQLLARRIADWMAIGEKTKTVICIKPHRGGAMSRPAEAVSIIRQLGKSPWLRMVYDYSHYAFRNMPLATTVKTAAEFTAHVAVKDAVQREGKTTFVLPGESGNFDYARLLQLLTQAGYRGDICCEVSSAVWRQGGYQPEQAAKTCYRNLSAAFRRAGVSRPPRGKAVVDED